MKSKLKNNLFHFFIFLILISCTSSGISNSETRVKRFEKANKKAEKIHKKYSLGGKKYFFEESKMFETETSQVMEFWEYCHGGESIKNRITYNTNGVLISKIQYKNEWKNGEAFSFYGNGQMETYTVYKNDSLVLRTHASFKP